MREISWVGGISFSLLIKCKTIVCPLLRNETKVVFLSVKIVTILKKVSREINVNYKQYHIIYKGAFYVHFHQNGIQTKFKC